MAVLMRAVIRACVIHTANFVIFIIRAWCKEIRTRAFKGGLMLLLRFGKKEGMHLILATSSFLNILNRFNHQMSRRIEEIVTVMKCGMYGGMKMARNSFFFSYHICLRTNMVYHGYMSGIL